MTFEIPFAPFNSRRYGRPWGATVTFVDSKPAFDFTGHWDGKVVVIEAADGDVIAFGQRDYRGRNTTRTLAIITGDTWTECTETKARHHWTAREKGRSAA